MSLSVASAFRPRQRRHGSVNAQVYVLCTRGFRRCYQSCTTRHRFRPWRKEAWSTSRLSLANISGFESRTSAVTRGRYLSTCSTLYAVSVDANKGTIKAADLDAPAGLPPNAATEPSVVVESATSVDMTAIETSASAKWAFDAANVLTELPEQGDLASLGLCANTPVGWLQSVIESVHIHAGLPWWGAIVVSTIILRAVIFPVVMRVQRNGVLMNNINPEVQKLMKKQREYRQLGNKTLADQCSHKIWNVYQKHNCNPLKMAVMPLIQLPLFLSFFIAIRKMAAVPVESMKTGGVLWFEDLTAPDPYYILPILACGSFVASIEVTCTSI